MVNDPKSVAQVIIVGDIINGSTVYGPFGPEFDQDLEQAIDEVNACNDQWLLVPVYDFSTFQEKCS